MSDEQNQNDRPKTVWELFFQWLSDFTLPIVKDKYGVLIIAAGMALGIASYSIGANSDSIIKVINVFKDISK